MILISSNFKKLLNNCTHSCRTHLGLVSQPLQRVNNSLQLFYSSEEVCTDGDKPSYSAIIKFNCDSEMNVSGLFLYNFISIVFILIFNYNNNITDF